MLHDSYKQAKKLLKSNREIMDKLADYLIEKETITGKEFMKIYRKEKGIPEPEEEEKDKKETSEKGKKETPEKDNKDISEKDKKEALEKDKNQAPENAKAAPQNQSVPQNQNVPQPDGANVGLFSHSSILQDSEPLRTDFSQTLAEKEAQMSNQAEAEKEPQAEKREE